MKAFRRLLTLGDLPALSFVADRRLFVIAVCAFLLVPAVTPCRANPGNLSILEGIAPQSQKDIRESTQSIPFRSSSCSVLISSISFPETGGVWKPLQGHLPLEIAAILMLVSTLWAEVLRRRVQNQKTLLQEWARREVALKEKYQELFENANDIVFTTDLEGKLTSINRAAEELTGYSRQDAIGADLSSYIAEEYQGSVQQKLRGKFLGAAPTTDYLEILTRKGGRVPLEVSSRLIYEGGKPVGVQGIARDITERKVMEQQLVLREKRLASFFADAPAGLAILDHQLRLVRINKTLAQINGLSPQESIGKSIHELLPKFAPALEPAMRKVLRDRKPLINFPHEGEAPSQPGVTRHLISSYFPIPALQGDAADLAIITVEVTDRKRAEEALRQSEERLNSILSSLRDVVWSVTPEDHRTLYLNPATETVYGRKVTEFYHDPDLWLKTVHSDDRKLAAELLPRLINAGSVDQEFRIVRPDGEIRWLYDRSRTIRNSGGAIVRFDGISTDITDRKQMEEGLKLYREVFARSNEAVAILDPEFRFIEQNEAHRKLLGYSDEELRKTHLKSLMGDKTFREAYQQGRHAGSSRTETVFRTRSGKALDVELSAFRILGHTGDTLCSVGMVRDITAQKRAEFERQKAREAAEAANRAKSEFLANMSHEIRTPLNGILGMTELALNTNLSEEQREYLTMVQASGESLLTVINDILDFSKIEAGRLDLNPIDFELRDSLGDTLKTLSLRAHEKGLELALHVAPDVPYWLEGDPIRLQQIVVNLVNNAIKFTEHGEVVLHVGVESQAQKQITLHLTVTDTGVGIPADKQEIIFAPFTQADSSTTRRFGGTGLGLTISFQLADLMGGRLWVESEEGKGSSFHFTVCFGPSSSKGRAETSPDAVRLRGMPVLVVDDNATNRRLLEEILIKWDMRPEMADGGRSGLATMERAQAAGKTFPLVLIDACMPDMDGFTLAERIKQDPTLAGATIMMLTSAGHRGDATRCHELGIAAYLHKPIKERDLLQAIFLALEPPGNDTEDAELITRHTLSRNVRSLRILLAEDDLVNRQLAEHILRNACYQVTAVQNGQQVLEMIQNSDSSSFDVVLMDVQMPGMDGLEATAVIREMEQGTSKRLPIIAMTAHAMKGDRARFLKAGMDGYVAKPVQARQLLSTIEDVLSAAESIHPKTRLNVPQRPPIDWKLGLARVEGDSELFHDLLKLFASQAPAALDKLRDGVKRNDAEAIQRTAHMLKGSLGNFSADEAVQAASRLETVARNQDLNHVSEASRRLEMEVGRVLAAIEVPESEVSG